MAITTRGGITDFLIPSPKGVPDGYVIETLDGQYILAPYNVQGSLVSDTTLTSSDSGKIFTNKSATGTIIITVPASQGFGATFIVTDAFEFRIKADTDDVIFDGVIYNDYIKSAEVGSVAEIYAVDDTHIFVRSAKGNWVGVITHAFSSAFSPAFK